MNTSLKILIIEDHPIFVAAVESLLVHELGQQVVGTTTSAKEGIQLVKELQPNLVLMDVDMKPMSGLEASQIIKQEHPSIQIMLMTAFVNYNYISEALKLKVDGYLVKSMGLEEFNNALGMLSQGKPYFPAEVMQHFLTFQSYDLTNKELEVIELVGKGLNSAEIAKRMYISPKTVDWHRKNILHKTGAQSVPEFARKNGF